MCRQTEEWTRYHHAGKRSSSGKSDKHGGISYLYRYSYVYDKDGQIRIWYLYRYSYNMENPIVGLHAVLETCRIKAKAK
jgi:hypothetical protein